MMTSDSFNMTLTHVFDAPLEKVWNAWAEEKSVRQWWGPTGFTCPFAKIVFREGGTSLVCMRAPQEYGGMDMYNTWNYKAIKPMESIEFIQGWADKDGNTIDPSTLGLPPGLPKEIPHHISFKKMAGNKTEMTVTEYGYPSAEIVELSRTGMNQVLDKMAESFKN